MKFIQYLLAQMGLLLAVSTIVGLGLCGEIDPHSAFVCGAGAGLVCCLLVHTLTGGGRGD